MTHVFPAEPFATHSILTTLDRSAVAAAGIREVITLDPQSDVVYSFEIRACDEMLLEVFANGKVDVVITTDNLNEPQRALLASTATVLHQILLRAPERMYVSVRILNHRDRPAQCQIHAVTPLSAVGKEEPPLERDAEGLPIVRLEK